MNKTIKILRFTARLLMIAAPFMLFSGLITANPYLVGDGFAMTASTMHKAIVPAFFVPLLAIHSIMGILFLMMRNKNLNRFWLKAAAVSAWSLIFVVFGFLYFSRPAQTDERKIADAPAKVDTAKNHDEAKAVVEKKCTKCHGLDTVYAKKRSKAEWRSVVDSMQKKGAGLTDKEVEIVIDYLTDKK